MFRRRKVNAEDEATHSQEDSTSTQQSTWPVVSDNPIDAIDEDTLARAKSAEAFAQEVLSLDASRGLVIGVMGPWGSGKTSFINLARRFFDVAEVAVLDFNPWMFSGAQQLVDAFFVELSAQLRIREGLGDVGQRIEEYGEAFSGLGWLPIVGPWIERGRGTTKIVGALLQRRKEGVLGRKATLEKSLAALEKPLIVVIDDVDRLASAEIRDLFKLVRLTASLPNIVYIVAFDRQRVEKALGDEGVPGRDYLEKILQVAVDLPAIPDQVLVRQTLVALDRAITDISDIGPFNEAVWPDIFVEIVRPLIRNMRDVRRYAAAVRGTVNSIGSHVALADVLALEAVRVFLPDVFARLHSSVEALTNTSGGFYPSGSDAPRLRADIEDLAKAFGPDRAQLMKALVARLFPAALRYLDGPRYGDDFKRSWLLDRRVAHEHIFLYYLERTVGEGLLNFLRAELAWGLMTDLQAFDEYMHTLSPDTREDVVASLLVYEDRFTTDHAIPGAIVFLNLLDELPEKQRGMLELGGELLVGQLLYRLMRTFQDPAEALAATQTVLPHVKSLASKHQMIDSVGHRINVGHKFVTEDAANELEFGWREEVRLRPAAELARERNLLWILLLLRRESGPGERALQIDDSTYLTLAVLRSARSEVRGQSMRSRSIHRSTRLAWDALVELYGSDALLITRVGELAATDLGIDQELVSLALRYASGWRPSDFGDA